MTGDGILARAEERMAGDLTRVHHLPLGCGRPLYDPEQPCACACSFCNLALATCKCTCHGCGLALHHGCTCERPMMPR